MAYQSIRRQHRGYSNITGTHKVQVDGFPIFCKHGKQLRDENLTAETGLENEKSTIVISYDQSPISNDFLPKYLQIPDHEKFSVFQPTLNSTDIK